MGRSEKNLTAVFTDTASAIRAKTGTTEQICPLDFADKINAIETGGGTGGGMKAYFDAGGKCAYSNKLTTFDGLINYSDTENVSDFSYFFENCNNLVSSPNINTDNATGSMTEMFYSCTNITSISSINTSNVTSMSDMFAYCSYLTTIPLFNTSKVSNMSRMFNYCTHLTSVPKLDTSSVTDMSYMFAYCRNLTVIPELDASKCEDFNRIFYECTGITEIHMTGMRSAFDISYSTKFTRDALVEILNNLGTPRYSWSKTITMGETNLAKLTDEDKAIATNKGWTLA